MRALVVLALLAAAPAAADEGEVYFGAGVALDTALLRHPIAASGDVLAFDDQTSFAILPRLGAVARYGVTNELHLAISFEASAAANVSTPNVALAGTVGTLISGGYFEVAAPLAAVWRIDSGYDVAGTIGVETGPMLALWTGNALADPTKVDDDGRPARLPLEIQDELLPGALVRLTALVECRALDRVVIRAGPSVTIAWAATPSVRAAIVVEAAWVTPIGAR